MPDSAVTVFEKTLEVVVGTQVQRNRTVPAKVRATEAGIRSGNRMLDARFIARAYYQPRRTQKSTVVCVDERGGALFEAEVDDEEDARAFLCALGHDPARERLELFFANPVMHIVGVRFVMALAVVCALAVPLYSRLGGASVFWVAAVLGLMALAVKSQRVEVGTEGMRVRWLGRSRFIGFDEIDRVETNHPNVILYLASGEQLSFAPESAEASRSNAALTNAAFQWRIEEGLRARSRPAGNLRRRLGRGNRTTTDWQANLAALREGDYRTAPTTDDELWEILEDPTAPADARAAAAIVLRKGDASAAPRVRIAAEAAEAPSLRIALERAADADETALEAVAAPKPARRA